MLNYSTPNATDDRGKGGTMDDDPPSLVLVVGVPVVVAIVIVGVAVVIFIWLLRYKKRQRGMRSSSDNVGVANEGFSEVAVGKRVLQICKDNDDIYATVSVDSGFSDAEIKDGRRDIDTCEVRVDKALDSYPKHYSDSEFCTIGSFMTSQTRCENPSGESQNSNEDTVNYYENVDGQTKNNEIQDGSLIKGESNTIDKTNGTSIVDLTYDHLQNSQCFRFEANANADKGDAIYCHTDKMNLPTVNDKADPNEYRRNHQDHKSNIKSQHLYANTKGNNHGIDNQNLHQKPDKDQNQYLNVAYIKETVDKQNMETAEKTKMTKLIHGELKVSHNNPSVDRYDYACQQSKANCRETDMDGIYDCVREDGNRNTSGQIDMQTYACESADRVYFILEPESPTETCEEGHEYFVLEKQNNIDMLHY